MRITVAHNRPKDQVISSIDRSFDDLIRGIAILPIQFVEEKRVWQGSVCTFSIKAKMGPLSTPILGTITVTDTDVTIDLDLGLLNRFLPAAKTRDTLAGSVRALLR